ncbi:hypothetical protein AV530_004544 [Patagioenas fasciata monilis]|uniref:Uncharacterized protein n=1 Tax=Patagioenas fasciata monilis TaxID=372326 RepID=A0A1V4J696_PATFA|nr:hypothetical protein AV530_004544 [Patagioenas fasciata monilis]
MDVTNTRRRALPSHISPLAAHNSWCFPRRRALTAAGSPDGEPPRARVGVEGRGGGVKRGGTGADNGRRSGERSLTGDDCGLGTACRRAWFASHPPELICEACCSWGYPPPAQRSAWRNVA